MSLRQLSSFDVSLRQLSRFDVSLRQLSRFDVSLRQLSRFDVSLRQLSRFDVMFKVGKGGACRHIIQGAVTCMRDRAIILLHGRGSETRPSHSLTSVEVASALTAWHCFDLQTVTYLAFGIDAVFDSSVRSKSENTEFTCRQRQAEESYTELH